MLNFGMLFRWGSILMNMANDPNIHMLARGAWAGVRKLSEPPRPPGSPPSAQVTPGRAQSSTGLVKPFSPEFPDFGQFPAADSNKPPTEAEMRRMLKQMGVSAKPLQRQPGMADRRSRSTWSDRHEFEGQLPFPWLGQENPEGNSRKRGRKR